MRLVHGDENWYNIKANQNERIKMKKRSVPITEHFDSVSSQIAGAMRSVFVKYKSLTENLGEVQRGMESAKAICQALYRTIDGPCWEILATDPKYRTDNFVQKLYDAMTNTSIRKWTRDHLKIVRETKDQPVRKFLEIRLCIMKTLVGTSEMIFNAVGNLVDKTTMADFANSTKKECDNIAWADENTIRKGRKRQ